MKKMDSSVLQFACWFNPCFHPKVKVRTPAERFLKAKKSVRKDWPHQKETETSCQKDDCLWDEKNKMYSLENFRRDWHPVGNVVWRKLYKDKEMSEKRTESWADDGEGHTCAERKKAIPGHWLERNKTEQKIEMSLCWSTNHIYDYMCGSVCSWTQANQRRLCIFDQNNN